MSETEQNGITSILFRVDKIEQVMSKFANQVNDLHNLSYIVYHHLITDVDGKPGLVQKQIDDSRRINTLEKIQIECSRNKKESLSKWQAILIPTITSAIISLVVVGLTLKFG